MVACHENKVSGVEWCVVRTDYAKRNTDYAFCVASGPLCCRDTLENERMNYCL